MDAPPQTPAPAATTNNTTMTDSPPKYVPKFSAATELILQRMKSGLSGGLSSIGITETPPGYEEMRRNVMQGMKTTHNMEINTPPRYVTGRRLAARSGGSSEKRAASTTSAGSTGGKKRSSRPKAGQKRKRVKDESDSAEDSETMSRLGGDSDSEDTNSVTPELPKITQSGRQVVKPTQFVPAMTETSSRKRSSTSTSKRNQEQALCKRCGRGNSPQNNMIVFCDGCNLGWHQMCHDPIVSEEEVKDEQAPWYCADCSRKKGIKSAPSKADGVSWAGKTVNEKRAYFESLPHPQLVSLLMKSCTLHPALPIFPANAPAFQFRQSHTHSWMANQPQQPLPPSATSTAGLFSRAESNPNAPINFIRKIAPNSSSSGISPSPMLSTSFSSTSTFPHASSAPPTLPPQSSANVNGNGTNNGQQAQESRESTPNSPPYPRAGTGLMSKLGPDEEDLEWLVDHGDYEAFSHVVYDEQGNKIEDGAGLEGLQNRLALATFRYAFGKKFGLADFSMRDGVIL